MFYLSKQSNEMLPSYSKCLGKHMLTWDAITDQLHKIWKMHPRCPKMEHCINRELPDRLPHPFHCNNDVTGIGRASLNRIPQLLRGRKHRIWMKILTRWKHFKWYKERSWHTEINRKHSFIHSFMSPCSFRLMATLQGASQYTRLRNGFLVPISCGTLGTT